VAGVTEEAGPAAAAMVFAAARTILTGAVHVPGAFAMSAAFDPVAATRAVLRAASTGALATLTPSGTPFASLVTVATDVDGTPLMLLSTLAVHTRNLDADGRCSLLLVAPGGEGGDPLAGARATLEGRAERIASDDPGLARARARFLARHPEAEGYAAFADFGVFRLVADTAHLVAGFGRIHAVPATGILVGADSADAFAAAAAEIVGHMNEDHADAVGLYATRLLGRPPADWRVVAVDPDGLDLSDGAGAVVRLPFPVRLEKVMALRGTLKALADAARAAG
jgi:putative heme iron utilization protein